MKKIRIFCRFVAGMILAMFVICAVTVIAGCDDSSMYHEFQD